MATPLKRALILSVLSTLVHRALAFQTFIGLNIKPTTIQNRHQLLHRSHPRISARIVAPISKITRGRALQSHHFPLREDSFFLTRIVFLRALAFVYGVAFLVAKHQCKALLGDNGITPAREILDKAEQIGQSTRERREKWLNSTVADGTPVVWPAGDAQENPWIRLKKSRLIRRLAMKINRNPRYQYWRERLWDRQDHMGRPVTTLLWLAKDRQNLNPWFDGVANGGLAMSAIVLILGAANVPLMLGLWVCQRSLMAVGGAFWGYGWEVQLAELGFHALFLVPVLSLDPVCVSSPPSKFVLYSIRCFLFRIMMGAGLIKLRSNDIKWKWPHLSAMDYFYETQPVPNPLTRYLHWMPKWWHKGEVLTNHFVELIAPWLLLVPVTSVRRTAGLIQVIFQAVLIASGNLSFLNWLTIVPTISCFDDSFLGRFFSNSWKHLASEAVYFGRSSGVRNLVSTFFVGWMAYLSIPVVRNLLSKQQLMNSSFGPLRLVNTYGAFGEVDEIRNEFIVSAASSLDGPWKEYEFKVKPGNVTRRPRFISPYHYRLDWQFWIASTIGNLVYSPWIYSFLLKVLEQDPGVLGLLESDPFQDEKDPPKFIRVDKYQYQFYKAEKSNKKERPYWQREYLGRVFPRQGVATVASLEEMINE